MLENLPDLMKTLAFDYGSIKKYIIYRGNSAANIYCVYKILPQKELTELITYKSGHIDSIYKLNYALNFNANKPLESIERFYKALILQ